MNRRSFRGSSGRQSVYDYMAKLVIIGDSGVGKTNILTRFCQNVFKQSHVATIGVDFNVRTIQIDDKKIRLQVWDTAGQERFKTITQTYYKGAHGIILVYAVDSKDSFQSIDKWINQVNQRTSPHVKKLLIANKIDLDKQNIQISKQMGLLLANTHNLSYLQVSAKANKNIDQIFFTIAKELKTDLETQNKNDQLSRTISINNKGNSWNQKNVLRRKEDCAC